MQELGWQIGLRFDPLIYHNDFNKIYGDFFKTVFVNYVVIKFILSHSEL